MSAYRLLINRKAPVQKKPIIRPSMLSKPPRYFYIPQWREVDNGKALEVVNANLRRDVTDSVEPLVEMSIIQFLDYCMKVHGLELFSVPDSELEEENVIRGVAEVTGYKYLNDLIAEWRAS